VFEELRLAGLHLDQHGDGNLIARVLIEREEGAEELRLIRVPRAREPPHVAREHPPLADLEDDGARGLPLARHTD